MKKILFSLLCATSISAFADVGDSSTNGFLNIVNNTESDILIYSINTSNNFMFKCLIQVPNKYQIVKSPNFKNQMIKNGEELFPVQTFTVSKTSTVQYQINDACHTEDLSDIMGITLDSKLNLNKTTSIGILHNLHVTQNHVNFTIDNQTNNLVMFNHGSLNSSIKQSTLIITNHK